MEESPDAQGNPDPLRPFTNDVYEATPSSGSGGGDEDEEEEVPSRTEKLEHIQAIDKCLEPPHSDSIEKVSDWVNQVSSEDAVNPSENENGTTSAHEEDGQEGDPMETDAGAENEGGPEGAEEQPKTFKLFVSNLPPGVSDVELKEMFGKIGEVAECEIFAKSYAFVFMTCEEATTKAIEELNGFDLRGCKINVKRSVQSGYSSVQPKPALVPPKPASKVKAKLEPVCEIGTFKIYVGNLPEEVKKEDVTKLLEPYGRTVEVEIYRDTSAFVHMETEEGAKKAIEELSGKVTLPECEKPLTLSVAKNPEGPSTATFKFYVSNISATLPPQEIRELFRPYGLVLKVIIPPRRVTSDARNAIVYLEQFGNIRSAMKDLNGKEICGLNIKVVPFVEKPKAKPNPTAVTKPKPTPVMKPRVQRSSKPVFDTRPIWHESEMPPVRPSPNNMRLIPMPSESELIRLPRSGRGRRLLNPDQPPPPLMAELPFVGASNRPPWQRGRGREQFSGQNAYEPEWGHDEGWAQTNNERWSQNHDEGWYQNDNEGWGQHDDEGWGQNDNEAWGQNDNESWNQDDNRGWVQNSWGYNEDGGDYGDIDDCDVFDYSQQNQGFGGNMGPPPNKRQRPQSWQNNNTNSSGFSGRNPSMNGNNMRSGKPKIPSRNTNPNNPGNSKGRSTQGLFPQFPKPEAFPKGQQARMKAQQVASLMDQDWSSDDPISNFSQFSSNQDFTADEPMESETLNAVPFDYSQMRKKAAGGNWQANQRGGGNNQRGGGNNQRGGGNNQRGGGNNQRGGGNQQRGGGNPQRGIGNSGGGGNVASGKKKKGKSRRPGLGTVQQQKKTANQSGGNPNAEPLGPWVPVTTDTYSATSSSTATSSSNAYAPYYSQQQNNRYFTKGPKKAPKKTLKEIEEEQKKQYSDYLKQKPWLYQPIPGTVKRVGQ